MGIVFIWLKTFKTLVRLESVISDSEQHVSPYIFYFSIDHFSVQRL